MTLSPALITKFQIHYFKVFGTRISVDDAELELARLANIVCIISPSDSEVSYE